MSNTAPVRETMTLDQRIRRLTTGELAELQRRTGKAWSDTEAFGTIEFLQALYFLWQKREDRHYTWSQVEIATLEDVQSFLGLDGDDEAPEVPVDPKS